MQNSCIKWQKSGQCFIVTHQGGRGWGKIILKETKKFHTFVLNPSLRLLVIIYFEKTLLSVGYQLYYVLASHTYDVRHVRYMRKFIAPDALSIITSEVSHQAACQLQTSPVGFSLGAAGFVVVCNCPILRSQNKWRKWSFRYCSGVLWDYPSTIFHLPWDAVMLDYAGLYTKKLHWTRSFLVPEQKSSKKRKTTALE